DAARRRDRRCRAHRCRDRLPLVQRVSGRGVHGRYRRDGDRRRAGGPCRVPQGRAPTRPDRRHLPDRGALGDPPGGLVQVLGPPDLPDGAAAPSLRDEGVVRDEDHGSVLDRDRAPVRRRVRALLPLLLPAAMKRALVYGLARSGEAAAAALERRGVEVVRVDRLLGNEDDLSLLDRIEVLVKSPGVPGERRLVEAARGRGVPVWSEVELGYRLNPERPIVGVTGTNGKTTTCE